MKKIFLQFILLIAATALLASCGNMSKMSLTKRHYRSGYFVDFSRDKHIKPVSRITIAQKSPILPVSFGTSTDKIISNKPIPNDAEPRITAKNLATEKKKTGIAGTATVPYFPLLTAVVTQNHATTDREESITDHRTQVNVNVSFALIVICAIFIPPLGVALMYGINSYFWIDLILTLLFFFPGMIFALIVVLS